MDKQLFFVTLNWNTTDWLKRMVESVEATTPEPHRWIVVDNGSQRDEEDKLFEYFGMGRGQEVSGKREYAFLYPDLPRSQLRRVLCCGPKFPEWTWQRYFRDVAMFRGGSDAQVIIIKSIENMGCVLALNLAFDVAKLIADERPHEIVMVDSDVEVFEVGWLGKALSWADDHPNVGVIGMEHSNGDVCAPCIFLDTNGNWYLHEEQKAKREPVESETVGMALALIRWPVLEAGYRFATDFGSYYKVDDDLIFRMRAEFGLEAWVFPVDMVHWGSAALKANGYKVDGISTDWDSWQVAKSESQKKFAAKWAWALHNRRLDMAGEAAHLAEMKRIMSERRGAQR